MNLNLEGVMYLLHIEEKTRVQPRLKAIHDHVVAELEKLAVHIVSHPKEVERQEEPTKELVEKSTKELENEPTDSE